MKSFCSLLVILLYAASVRAEYFSDRYGDKHLTAANFDLRVFNYDDMVPDEGPEKITKEFALIKLPILNTELIADGLVSEFRTELNGESVTIRSDEVGFTIQEQDLVVLAEIWPGQLTDSKVMVNLPHRQLSGYRRTVSIPFNRLSGSHYQFLLGDYALQDIVDTYNRKVLDLKHNPATKALRQGYAIRIAEGAGSLTTLSSSPHDLLFEFSEADLTKTAVPSRQLKRHPKVLSMVMKSRLKYATKRVLKALAVATCTAALVGSGAIPGIEYFDIDRILSASPVTAQELYEVLRRGVDTQSATEIYDLLRKTVGF